MDWLTRSRLFQAAQTGTMVNPSALEDVDHPLGSAANPIVVEDDICGMQNTSEEHYSDADTVVMSTPEFWEFLSDCPPKSAEESAVGPSTYGSRTSAMGQPERAEFIEGEKSTYVLPVYKVSVGFNVANS